MCSTNWQHPAGRLVLGSGSETRAHILRNAGIDFAIRRPEVDEEAMRRALIDRQATVETAALMLAAEKAIAVSRKIGDAWVIGADQILECDGRWFEKPRTAEQAINQLNNLSGRRHRVVASVAIARQCRQHWSFTDQAVLAMRPLDESFIRRYVKVMGEKAFESVGGYQIEGLGAQLFERVDGDHFTILGLPLFPLLGFLRSRGLIEV